MQRSIVCEACKVFDVPYAHAFLSINHQIIKPEFLLLDIVLIVKTLGGGGGEVGGFGREASPLHPPADETLTVQVCPFQLLNLSGKMEKVRLQWGCSYTL